MYVGIVADNIESPTEDSSEAESLQPIREEPQIAVASSQVVIEAQMTAASQLAVSILGQARNAILQEIIQPPSVTSMSPFQPPGPTTTPRISVDSTILLVFFCLFHYLVFYVLT